MSEPAYTPYQWAKFISILMKRAQESNFKHGGVFICTDDGNYFEAHDFRYDGAIFQFTHNGPDKVMNFMGTPYDRIASVSM